MTRYRKPLFETADREAFFETIAQMRRYCLFVRSRAPINGLDYDTAGTLIERLDDAVGALTGNREALWRPPAGYSEPRPVHVLPVEK